MAVSTTLGMAAFLVVFAVERGLELALSRRNAARVRAAGAVEHGGRHFAFVVALHTLFPIALTLEVAVVGVRPGPLWWLWLGIWLVAQVLRYSAVAALGERWNVRILVIPGRPRVRRGPYRWLRHPNYVAVVLELASAPLMFGAWRTALIISLVNAIALAVRIRAENHALAWGEAAKP